MDNEQDNLSGSVRKELERKSIRGGTITLGVQVVSVLMQLTSTVVLARILTPDDYGIMAIVLSISAFAALFKDLGLSSASIQRVNITDHQISNLFWLNFFFGLILTVIMSASSPLVASFFDREELLNLTIFLSLVFLISSIGTQHHAMLVRDMRFGEIGVISLASMLLVFIVSLVLAYNGWGYWALAWGTVAGAASRTLALWILVDLNVYAWKKNVEMRELLGFGFNVTLFKFCNYFSRNLDNLLIGKFVGAGGLGLYSRAYQLIMFPILNLRAPIESVVFPAMSRLQDDCDGFRRYFLGATFFVASITMPLMAFCNVYAHELISLALGPQWVEAASIFEILSIVGIIQPVAGMQGTVMMSLGLSARFLFVGLASAVWTSVAFMIGVAWGVEGVAWSYVFATLTAMLPLQIWSFRSTPVKWTDVYFAIRFPLIVSAIIWLTCTGSKLWIGQDASVVETLMLGGVVTLVAYSIFLCIVPEFKPFRGAVKKIYQTGRLPG